MKAWLYGFTHICIGKDLDAGRDWGQEEKGTTEDEMSGWHHRLDAHEFGWTPGVGDGQGGLVCCNSWGHKESDTTEQLNWTELNWGSASGKEPTCQCRRRKRCGFVPGSGRSPGGGHGNPLQYSCLENPMDRGAWQATVHGVTKSQTQLKLISMHIQILWLKYSILLTCKNILKVEIKQNKIQWKTLLEKYRFVWREIYSMTLIILKGKF